MVRSSRDLRPYDGARVTRTIVGMTTEAATGRTSIVHITTKTTVAEARRALDLAGANLALAMHHGRPVGIVTRDDLDAARAGDDEPVIDVMTTELVHIDPATGDLQTLDIYRHAAWASLRRRAPGRRRAAARWRERHQEVER